MRISLKSRLMKSRIGSKRMIGIYLIECSPLIFIHTLEINTYRSLLLYCFFLYFDIRQFRMLFFSPLNTMRKIKKERNDEEILNEVYLFLSFPLFAVSLSKHFFSPQTSAKLHFSSASDNNCLFFSQRNFN